MGKLTVYQTDKGYYSVRPIDWECEIDKYGRIVQNGWNHTGIFSEKEDANFFCKTKNSEEQGKLLILPCKVNDRVHSFYESDIEGCFERGMEVEKILQEMCEERRVIGFDVRGDGLWILLNGGLFNPDIRIPIEEFGKTVFLTEQEAKEALEGMKNE